MKAGVVLGLVVAVVAFLTLGRPSKADAVRDCMSKAGATTKERPEFGRVFPYLIAAGANTRVGSFHELDDATVYGVAYGEGEAVLFVGKEEEDAREFARTLGDFGATGGIDVPSRRAGNVLLIWAVPPEPSAAAVLEGCVK